jgi:CRISPR-associated endonuclease Csy4
MQCYLEITLLPNEEIPLYFLWEKVYQQLHLAFVAIKDESGKMAVGVSFPHYDEENHQLGKKLRLFAETEELLQRFDADKWLDALSDYVHLTRIKPVPEKIEKHGCFYRIQLKSQVNRAQRKSRRKNISVEKALHDYDAYVEQRTKAPFINLKSASSRESFKLFIGYVEQVETSEKGFSCYGLSRQSTVPIF